MGLALSKAGASAVPERTIVCERIESVIVTLPEAGPSDVGAKTTLMLHIAWAPSETPHVPELRNPELVTISIPSRIRSPLFESVTI